ncbi:cytochrome C [Tunturibacter empetritectus]|uniref:Cytochrome c domain-containing protein n=1 Tax=Tunturiibacter lichenicola TaxID=2051959 RepID=A0A7W8N3P4_9BACT|nr:cytochrome C [Edaphobacter lichenicola]MBB5344717.1 hypothetical protein [Edaphobacter lichenicola]
MKNLTAKVLLTAGLVTLVGAIHHTARADDEDSFFIEHQRIAEGFRIAPVRLNLEHKNPEMVGLGSYLVNAIGGCNDCHTNPSYAVGGNPFLGQPKQINTAGYLAGGQTFGPFISRNLTPENGLPAGRTYAEFKNILRTGIDYDHLHPQISPLLQVMPWPTYQSLKDHDIKAIYEYLSAIPSIPPSS